MYGNLIAAAALGSAAVFTFLSPEPGETPKPAVHRQAAGFTVSGDAAPMPPLSIHSDAGMAPRHD